MSTSNKPDHTGRHQEIVETALMIVHETGLCNLTMRKVAERLPVTEAALYRYFPTKDDLIIAIHDHLNQSLGRTTRQFLERDDLTAEQKLAATWTQIVEILDAQDGFPLRLLAESYALESPRHREKLSQIIGENQRYWEDIVAGVVPAGCPVRPRELALLVVGFPAAMALWGIHLDDPEIVVRAREELIPFVLKCLSGGGPKEKTVAV